jgi:anthranilate phosphoribosyltransferase
LTSFPEKEQGSQNNVVCANAGMAIATVTKCALEGFQIAKESLLSGKD